MNASELLLAELLALDGWSCWPGYHVGISKADKVAIGQPSHPTPELDVLGVKHGRVIWVESKTYLDSRGVQAKTLEDGYKGPGRVRVFTDPVYRGIVTRALLEQLREREVISKRGKTKVEYWFAAWKFCDERNRAQAQARFDEQGWTLLDRDWLVDHLRILAETSYRNSTAALVAKLLLRDPPAAR